MAAEWSGTPVEGAAQAGELVAFYKAQAEKLQIELGRLQRQKYARRDDTDLPPEPTGAAAEWSMHAEALPPLVRAYDERIEELTRAEAAALDRAAKAEARLSEAEASNTQLSTELQSALEASLRREAFVASGAARYVDVGGAEVAELKSRLEVLFQENDVLTDQAKATAEELDRLRAEKLAHAQEHMALVKQLGSVREELDAAEARAARAVEARDTARAELQRTAADLLTAQEHTQQAMAIAERHAIERNGAMGSVEEQRTSLTQLEARVTGERDGLLRSLREAQQGEREAVRKLADTQQDLQTSRDRVQALSSQLSAVRSDNEAGSLAIQALETRNSEAEAKVAAQSSQLAQLQGDLDDALLNREQLEERTAQAEATAKRLEAQARTASLEERTRREQMVVAFRKEAASRVASLQEELRLSEALVSELQHKLQRREREVGRGYSRRDLYGAAHPQPPSLPTALALPPAELFESHGGGGRVRMEGTRAMEEMAVRLSAAEQGRDEAEAARRGTAAQLRAQVEAAAHERATLATRIDALQRQVRRLEEEASGLRQERSRTLSVKAELEQESARSASELASLKHKHAEEMRVLKLEHELAASALQKQLQDAREQHERSSAEVEELLGSQEELAERYREEAAGIAARSEALVQELRAEAERLSIRNSELSAQLAASVSRCQQLTAAERQAVESAAVLRHELTDAHAARSALNANLLQLRNASKSWQQEKKQLQRQLQRSQVLADVTGVGSAGMAATAAAGSGLPARAVATGAVGRREQREGGVGCLATAAATAAPVAVEPSRGSPSAGSRRVRSREPREAATQEVESALAQARLLAQQARLASS